MRFKFLVLFFFLFLSVFFIACSCSDSSSGNHDTTAPVWGDGFPQAFVMDTRLYVKANINENGEIFCVLLPDGSTAPSVQQVIEGQDSTGTAVGSIANTEAVTGETSTLVISGLEYWNNYDLYCVAQDVALNRQASVVMIDVSVESQMDAVYVSKTGNDANPGDIENPKLTINGAITEAAFLTADEKKVRVSQGTYEEDVALSGGISLLGGYSGSDWSTRDIEDRENPACSTVISGSGTDAFTIDGGNPGTGDWVIEGFTIETSNSTASHGIYCNVDAGEAVKIRYNTINGGNGANESYGVYIVSGETEISDNDINGGNSSAGISNGIRTESADDQVISNSIIDGGSGYIESYGIVINYPVSYNTIVMYNEIYGGSSDITVGIAITNDQVNSVSTPCITGNKVDGGEAVNLASGIAFSASADTCSIEPVICNNLINSGTGINGYGIIISSIDGTSYLYNNIICAAVTAFRGIYLVGSLNRESNALIINNIIFGGTDGIVENEYGFCSELKNNDIYSCTHLFSSSTDTIDTTSNLNTYRTDFTDNISEDASLDNTTWNFTTSTPSSITQGGLDLSTSDHFPENMSGNPIDITGTVRTLPWSIGSYERD